MADRTDPFDALQRGLHAEPVPEPGDERLAQIVQEAMRASEPVGRRRRWLRRLTVMGVVGALAGGGGLAYAVLHGGAVTHPEGGVACRAEADPHASAYVLGELGADPVAQCRAVWEQGELPDAGGVPRNPDAVPALFACVSPGGGVDVYPAGRVDSCQAMGLLEPDLAAAAADPAIDLQRRISDEIPRCSSVDDTADAIRGFLRDLGMAGWRVVVREGDLPCGLAGVDSATSTVFVVPGPRPPGLTTP
jgi:hypothetical protein